jgi:hypothetical protein
MVAVLVMAMWIGASAVGLRALTANGSGGVECLSGGMERAKYGAKQANGAIRFLRGREKAYQKTYQRGRDPPRDNRHLGRVADAQVEGMGTAERFAGCLRGKCAWG